MGDPEARVKALVTGGGGFLGSGIVRRLLDDGWQVRTLTRSDLPALRARGVDVRRGDIGDPVVVADTVAGCDVVYHAAAKVGVWGPARDYERTNVQGTDNVLAACRAHGVERLVYTSTPSVTFAGEDQDGVDETALYPERYLCHYPRTKAVAERRVLAANGAKLRCLSLRPHLIWGPGDAHLVPRLLERARAGRLRIVGTRPGKVDTVYIDNAVDAHLLAGERLEPGSSAAGRAYFIGQDEPLPMRELIDRILAAGGLPPVEKTVSPGTAYAAGALWEFLYGALRILREPPMTRFVARQLATSHWFDIGAARRELGYRPAVSIDEGMRRLAAWLKT